MNITTMTLMSGLLLVGLVPTAQAGNNCDVYSEAWEVGVNYGPGGAGACFGENHDLTVEYDTSEGATVRIVECGLQSGCVTYHDSTGVTMPPGAICIVNNGNVVNCSYL